MLSNQKAQKPTAALVKMGPLTIRSSAKTDEISESSGSLLVQPGFDFLNPGGRLISHGLVRGFSNDLAIRPQRQLPIPLLLIAGGLPHLRVGPPARRGVSPGRGIAPRLAALIPVRRRHPARHRRVPSPPILMGRLIPPTRTTV